MWCGLHRFGNVCVSRAVGQPGVGIVEFAIQSGRGDHATARFYQGQVLCFSMFVEFANSNRIVNAAQAKLECAGGCLEPLQEQ